MNEEIKTVKYDSFGDYCCDTVMIMMGNSEYDVVSPDAAVRPSLSNFFEKAGYFVFNRLVNNYKISPETARLLMVDFENGGGGPHLPTLIWQGLSMLGQTVNTPLRIPFDELLKMPIGSFAPLRTTLEETASKIHRKFEKDPTVTLNVAKISLEFKNIINFPAPKDHNSSQGGNPAGSGCMLPLLFLILPCLTCFVAIIGLIQLF
jgi:hypothetical protein